MSKKYEYKKPLTKTQVKKIRLMANILIVLGFLMVSLAVGPIVRDEVWYQIKTLKAQDYLLDVAGGKRSSVFAKYLTSHVVYLKPVNTDFSIVIEKVGINAPIVKDVAVTDTQAYVLALRSGVAHASVSEYPSAQPGNTYLFAHSSLNFWELGKYAAVFNLLRKLDLNDTIYVFYNNTEYVYTVVNKETLPGWNTYPITRPVIEPTLTLQTCDPPGTTLNRLVLTAKLVESKAL